MAHFYRAPQRDQLLLMPTSMQEWLEEGHLAWFLIDVVATLDLCELHARHPNDGVGRPAYDPAMMLTLVLYAYATGLRSSRRIEACCRTDAAYRVICGGWVPDHTTIARFLVDHEDAIVGLFTAGLRCCAAAGLVNLATVAVDGTKIGSDAALDANHRAEWIRGQLAAMRAEHRRTDAAEDAAALFDESAPAALAHPTGRAGRLQAALARIEAEDAQEAKAAAEAADAAKKAAAQGHRLRGRKPTAPAAALARAEAELAAAQVHAAAKEAARTAKEADAAEQGHRLRGRRPAPDAGLARAKAALQAARDAAADAPVTRRTANVTDPDSRIMKSADGWVQGYNAQAAVCADTQVVLACLVSQNANDVELYQPMVAASATRVAEARVTGPVALFLADAGYWSEANATADGPDRLIATLKDWKQRAAARQAGTTTGEPPEGASPLEAMEHRLRTVEGAAAYSLRSHTVEPVFAEHKDTRGWRRFRRRGLAAAQSEWALMNLSHNLGKLFTHHHATLTGGTG